MNYEELAVSFDCREDRLIGVLSKPDQAHARAVLLVVGGPQYRAGSHRQFVLLARAIAAQGYPVLRFDYRGMGDSGGEPRHFEQVTEDIRAAIDCLLLAMPSVHEVVLWGLCDGASAAAFHAPTDPRVAGLVLVNPWCRSIEGEAKTRLTHYYRSQLRNPTFWKKIVGGRFNYAAAATSLWISLVRVTGRTSKAAGAARSLPDRLYDALSRFEGHTLLILSENDLTAQECRHMMASSPAWVALVLQRRIEQRRLAGADHTFSRRPWRDQVAAWTNDWLDQLPRLAGRTPLAAGTSSHEDGRNRINTCRNSTAQ
jgi:exosortase A-associated hydrolase 1